MNILEFLNQNKEITAALSSLITGAAAALFRYIEKGNLERESRYKIENLELDKKYLEKKNEDLLRIVNFQSNLIQYFLDKNEKE